MSNTLKKYDWLLPFTSSIAALVSGALLFHAVNFYVKRQERKEREGQEWHTISRTWIYESEEKPPVMSTNGSWRYLDSNSIMHYFWIPQGNTQGAIIFDGEEQTTNYFNGESIDKTRPEEQYSYPKQP